MSRLYTDIMLNRSKETVALYLSGIGYNPAKAISTLLLQDLKEARTIGVPLAPVEAQILQALLKGQEPPLSVYDHFSSLLRDQGYRMDQILLAPSGMFFQLRVRKGLKTREFLIGPCEAVLLSMKNGIDLIVQDDSLDTWESSLPLGELTTLFSFSEQLSLREDGENSPVNF